MKCYCCETKTEFILCVEGASAEAEEKLQHAWFQKKNERYFKSYPADVDDKYLIADNFARLGPKMFEGKPQWQCALRLFAQICMENNIEWYIIGSVSEVVLGVCIQPHDIDIIVHTKDFYKTKKLFPDAIIEPFVDNKGTWVVRFFGRICLKGMMIDIAADEKMNMESRQYDKISWGDYKIYIEPLQLRYQTEIQRNRADRVEAIKAYIGRC